MSLDYLAQSVLSLGSDISAISEKGMASVKMLWNPYKGEWEVSCSWSDSSEIQHSSESLTTALIGLKRLLKADYEKKKVWRKS